MAGIKGRGPIPADLREHCRTMLREVAARKMDTILTKSSPKDPTFRWVVETYASWGAVAVAQHEHTHSGSIDFRAEAQSFNSRMDRLVTRLGAAAMPEGIE